MLRPSEGEIAMTQLLIPPSGEALRRNNFDSLRLAMALLVVWSHSFALWYGTEDFEPVSLLFGGIYNSGNLGVLAFFAVSGFLITLSYERSSSALSYLKRRVLRIYPGYLVAILLCSLVIVPAFSSRSFGAVSAAEVAGLASNLLLKGYILKSDAFGGGAVNGSLWSIPYEFWCYLGILALGLSGFAWKKPVFPLVAGAVMLVRVWLDMTGRHPGGGVMEAIIGYPYLWFVVLPSFMLGASIYQYRDRIVRSGWLLVALVIATIASAHLPVPDPGRTILTCLLMPPTLAYAVFYVVFHPGIRLHNAARFGDFSYGTYLYAFPVQQMLVVLLKGKVPFALFVILSLVLSLAAGVCSWFAVEKWFLPRVRAIHAGKVRAAPLEEEAAVVVP
jgi:peptidoglycan/LPS O-acetylase OafA/YrhL